MGRGPGNARTEELIIEMSEQNKTRINIVPLMALIRTYFGPMKKECGWGSNPYYFLSGKYGIHPSYIQEMLSDSRYNEEDKLAPITHLNVEGGKKFSVNPLDATRNFYTGNCNGSWDPKTLFENKEVILLGSGPGVKKHSVAIESYIRTNKPIVLALNTQTAIKSDLIDVRVACHPVRLLADCGTHMKLPQPLITPASMLPKDVKKSLESKHLLDFGLTVDNDSFVYNSSSCVVPSSLVLAYALAVLNSGKASRIMMAGFDGYLSDDPRSKEIIALLKTYRSKEYIPLEAITPTRYAMKQVSVYAL
jgi:4-hydroxy 2-oxovalerate aldolase